MNIRLSVLYVVLQTATLFGLQALAQPSNPPNPALAFVTMPKDINCKVNGLVVRPATGNNTRTDKIDGSADGLTCWIGAKIPEPEVAILLDSTTIAAGMLTTKTFGKLKIVAANGVDEGVHIEIRRDKLQPLRIYLQKQESEIAAKTKHDLELSARAWALISEENANPAELSDALNAVAKAGLLEKTNSEGVTLLNKAAQRGMNSACEQLAKLGANPNAADAQGRSALYFVAAMLPSLYDLLVSKGGNENAPDAKGITPAETAGRFIPWKSIQAPADEDRVRELAKPSGPFFVISARMKGDILVDANNVFAVAADSKAPANVRVQSLGSGHLRVSSGTGVETISGNNQCAAICLLLPYESELELVTPTFLWGKILAPGMFVLKRDGLRFIPTKAESQNVTQGSQTGNQIAEASAEAGANFSSGSATTFTFSSNNTTIITIDPPTASLHVSESLQFKVTSTNKDRDTLIWTIKPLLGRISSTGLYEAPAVIERTQQITVTATIAQDPRESATATLTLIAK
jgi:hypothetical protein